MTSWFATLELPGARSTGADVAPEDGDVRPAGFSVLLDALAPADSEQVFARLSEGGTLRDGGGPVRDFLDAELQQVGRRVQVELSCA